MKTNLLVHFCLITGVAVLLAAAAMAQSPAGLKSPTPNLDVLEAISQTGPPIPGTHIPYDPFRSVKALPEYPYNALRPVTARRAGDGPTKPAGVDLDVTYISRTPLYHTYQVEYSLDMKPYLRPGTENDQRWPAPGELVTFTAHIANKGTAASGSFSFAWLIDGTVVSSGVHVSLAPGAEGVESYQWAWAHTLEGERLLGHHTVQFVVDQENTIPETYESNNSLTDRTDALSLFLAVSPELYAALETPVDPRWPFSAEDWLQKQIAAMNAAFERSIYPSVPEGIVERVRLDRLMVANEPPAERGGCDGGFFMTADDRFGNPYYDPETDVSIALLHELSHQLGVIDLYNLGFELGTPELVDQNGWPVQMETGLPPDGLMLNPGIRPPIYEEHSAHGLNANKGYRRGYYGEYLFDLPEQTYLRVLDNRGQPAADVTVRLFQSGPGRDLWPTIIDNRPEIIVTTDTNGLALLPNRSVGEPVTTRTGHTLRDNPFGIVDIVGEKDEFILELTRGTHQEYSWLEITRFNLAAWRGNQSTAILDIASHVPAADAPAAPNSLDGLVESGQVRLRWPASPSMNVIGYNVYRTVSRPMFSYERVAQAVDGTPEGSYTDPYDYDARAVAYAVTAVDASGRESGFSPFFNAFRLVNPAAVALDESGRRIVLDPQNGYALLLQLPNGRFFDTLGSVHYHLELSRFLARDALGRLIISHPGDWYDNRHSIRVASAEAVPLFEFGEQGSAAGQFQTPAGVAIWGQPCTIEGPYAADIHTLLLLHFDGSYDGALGETGSASGTTFADGKYSQGVVIDEEDLLTYPSEGNVGRTHGAVEFWLRPTWPGDDGQSYTFFEVGDEWFNRLRIMKDGANNLRFMVWDSATEYGVAYNVGHWQGGEWHHIAATWADTIITLWVDGQERDRGYARPPDRLAATMFFGSTAWRHEQANAVIDEFRISDIPRVGNSDTCSYRILVADSGNDRLQAFDATGAFVAAYGASGSGPGQFNDPQGIAVDGLGRVIVAERGNNRLQLLSFDGSSFSPIRSITAGFNGPTGVSALGDRIIVADTGNHKIKVLNADGALLAEYTTPNDGHTGPFNAPAAAVADTAGNIVVADTGNRRVATIRGALPVVTPTPSPTPTSTPTATPTPTLTPAPTCSEQVNNGGFETDSAWYFPVTASRAGYTTAQAHSGQRSARFGLPPAAYDMIAEPAGTRPEINLLGQVAPHDASFSSGYQTVSIPAQAESAILTFWYRPGTEATGGDYQRVMLLDPNGYTYITTLMKVLENSISWRKATFDLAPYRGRSIVLYFEVYNDDINAGPRTWMFLDDVSLQTCLGPTPVSASYLPLVLNRPAP